MFYSTAALFATVDKDKGDFQAFSFPGLALKFSDKDSRCSGTLFPIVFKDKGDFIAFLDQIWLRQFKKKKKTDYLENPRKHFEGKREDQKDGLMLLMFPSCQPQVCTT